MTAAGFEPAPPKRRQYLIEPMVQS